MISRFERDGASRTLSQYDREREQVREAGSLTELQREAVLELYASGLSEQSIAQLLNLKVNAVSGRILQHEAFYPRFVDLANLYYQIDELKAEAYRTEIERLKGVRPASKVESDQAPNAGAAQ